MNKNLLFSGIVVLLIGLFFSNRYLFTGIGDPLKVLYESSQSTINKISNVQVSTDSGISIYEFFSNPKALIPQTEIWDTKKNSAVPLQLVLGAVDKFYLNNEAFSTANKTKKLFLVYKLDKSNKDISKRGLFVLLLPNLPANYSVQSLDMIKGITEFNSNFYFQGEIIEVTKDKIVTQYQSQTDNKVMRATYKVEGFIFKLDKEEAAK
ncbi:TPA: hypothetical protein DEO28_03680 [Candidatus Dependentiae bacterium]|nr:MAG: hypothetical protein UR14_C0007G0037 [candidate division TM6 bacterium GW2011_GWE2_31_21]KKP53602.1 MAG: hypothetical protein UR43_C0004G0143 [candidate division TM6 bacterium GW2011_GWF2_33_332]HBS48158.1 hypothetical protein [Candidatus Dependentiae bacterium]HBZ73582.1 hypothetical protein [Candidatus Dependentiae bacterium]